MPDFGISDAMDRVSVETILLGFIAKSKDMG